MEVQRYFNKKAGRTVFKGKSMRLSKRFSSRKYVIGIILLMVIVSISCSSKSNKEKKEKSDEPAPVAVDSNEQAQSSVDKQVLIALENEIKQLKQENEKLKKALVELARRSKQTAGNSTAKRKVEPAAKQRESKDQHIDKTVLNSIVAELDSAVTADRKIELIRSLKKFSFEQDPSVLKSIRKALDDPDSAVGKAAMELLQDYDTPDILPVVEKALSVNNEQIRIDAVKSLSNVDDLQVVDLLGQALNDPSEDVRNAALETVEEYNEDIGLKVMEKGIGSAYKDVKSEVIQKLEDISNHKAVEILIEGLKDTDSSFRDEVNETLFFLIDKEFKSYEEAKQWWDNNKNKYDKELTLKDED
jgi:HEAT repeat protein